MTPSASSTDAGCKRGIARPAARAPVPPVSRIGHLHAGSSLARPPPFTPPRPVVSKQSAGIRAAWTAAEAAGVATREAARRAGRPSNQLSTIKGREFEKVYVNILEELLATTEGRIVKKRRTSKRLQEENVAMQRHINRAVPRVKPELPALFDGDRERSVTPGCGGSDSVSQEQAGTPTTVATKSPSLTSDGGGAPPLPKAAGLPMGAGKAGHLPKHIESTSAIKAVYCGVPAMVQAPLDDFFLLDAVDTVAMEHPVDVQMAQLISSDATALMGLAAPSCPLVTESVPSSSVTQAFEAAAMVVVAEEDMVVEPAIRHFDVTSAIGMDGPGLGASERTDTFEWASDTVPLTFSGDVLALPPIDMAEGSWDEPDFGVLLGTASVVESAAGSPLEFDSTSVNKLQAIGLPAAVDPHTLIGSPVSRPAPSPTVQVPHMTAQTASSTTVTDTSGHARPCERVDDCRLRSPLDEVSTFTTAAVEAAGAAPCQLPMPCRLCTGDIWDRIKHRCVCCKKKAAPLSAASVPAVAQRDPRDDVQGADGEELMTTTAAVMAA